MWIGPLRSCLHEFRCFKELHIISLIFKINFCLSALCSWFSTDPQESCVSLFPMPSQGFCWNINATVISHKFPRLESARQKNRLHPFMNIYSTLMRSALHCISHWRVRNTTIVCSKYSAAKIGQYVRIKNLRTLMFVSVRCIFGFHQACNWIQLKKKRASAVEP